MNRSRRWSSILALAAAGAALAAFPTCRSTKHTVARIVEDRDAGLLGSAPLADADDTAAWLAERAPEAITWESWQAIDAAERAAGEAQGRPRVKLVTLAELAFTDPLADVGVPLRDLESPGDFNAQYPHDHPED